ncbi:hypothetical protein B0H11DRAFT_2343516 [Mycena galericulata]|nr:hypothetical protein B0H11DRAFT_2343516 [Mycena galericulata]
MRMASLDLATKSIRNLPCPMEGLSSILLNIIQRELFRIEENLRVGEHHTVRQDLNGSKILAVRAEMRTNGILHTDYLKSLGATHVIDRKAVSTADVPAAVKKITSAPIKIVYDVISEAETRDACFAILATGGIAIAILPGDDKDVDGKKFIFVLGSTHVHREFGILMWKTLPKHVADGVIVKIFQPNRVEKLPNGLGGIVDGLKKMENNLISGLKLVAFPQETV